MAMAADDTGFASSLPEESPDFVCLDENFLCPVCQRPLISARQTPCGHRMCTECIEECLGNKPEGTTIQCPGGESDCPQISLDKLSPDHSGRKQLQQKEVRCTNEGCTEKMKWKDLKEHLSGCAHGPALKLCPYREFGCSDQITEREYDSHIYSECAYLPTECTWCKANFPQKSISEHAAQCIKKVVGCPHCGKQDTLEKIEDHQGICPGRPAGCKYLQFGCQYKGSKSDVERHLQEAAPVHVALMSAFSDNQACQIEKLKSQLQEVQTERERFKELREKLSSEQESLKQKVNAQETNIGDLQWSAALQAQKVAKLEEMNTTHAKQEEVRKQERDIACLKDNHSDLEGMVRSQEQVTEGATADLRQKVMTYDRQMGIHDVRLAEMDLRFKCLETSSYDGILIWKVTEYQRRKDEARAGKVVTLNSQSFYTGHPGYKICARVYLNGEGNGKNTHMSLFFVVMRGEYDRLLQWPFRCKKVILTLMDQTGGSHHCTDTFRPGATTPSFQKPAADMNIASGCPCFISQSDAENAQFLVDDCLFIKVEVKCCKSARP